MRRALDELTPLGRYTAASERSAARVIEAYSTSFGAATRLLAPNRRRHIRNLYALVRIADELVDGVCTEAGIGRDAQHEALDRLEDETELAMRTGYSSNPIVHAFATTARGSGIDTTLTGPFFASMRADLRSAEAADAEAEGTEAAEAAEAAGAGSAVAVASGPARAESAGTAAAPAAARAADGLLVFGDEAHAAYVYGSAEVVGLMCLRVFTADGGYTPGELERLEHGARRLGAAFQNVNFLRDLADDTERLGRSYLGQRATVDEALQARWVATIREQLTDAEDALPLLPRDARVAVGCALRFFSTLTDRIAAVPAAALHERRIRVPGPQKTWLIARSVLGAQKGGRT